MSLAPAIILSLGAVTPLGRDPEMIAQKLAESTPEFSSIRRVPEDLLSDPATAKSLRRADRFVRMASIAALDAASRAGSSVSSERIGLIVTSGLGPHGRGFKFLDGILDAGDAEALPTDFSHSVHGAAASYIAGLLDLRGPSLSTTDFELGFEHAILLAQTWLDQKTCDRVLVGAVEELGDVLINCAGRILGDNKISLGEGAVFFMLASPPSKGIATINTISTPSELEPDFTPWFGYSASSSAFQILRRLLSASRSLVVDNATSFRPLFATSGRPRLAVKLGSIEGGSLPHA
jgi:Beta-ketoacyl synthase, N-terminal domain